jgi:hypothetical protein
MSNKKIKVSIDIDIPDDEIEEMEKRMENTEDTDFDEKAGFRIIQETFFGAKVEQVSDSEEVNIFLETKESEDNKGDKE